MTTTHARTLPRFTILAAPDGRAEVEGVLRGLGGVEVVDAARPGAVQAAQGPAVMLLSSGLLQLRSGELGHVPDHIVLVATDAAGREAGEEAGRLFLSLEDASGDEAVLRTLRSAARHSAALLGQASAKGQLDQ